MKQYLTVMGVVVALLIAGGAVSSGLIDLSGLQIIQTNDPNASAFEATPEQANQFFFWIIFVIINVIGAGLTLALLFWLGNRAVERAKALPNPDGAPVATEEASKE
ncbi:MAG: hypothetical protein NZ750_00860 [Anaerolineae bacterium]|nr:hypothetical protein [Anaerolineae bacterium]MDW8173135.1 hypothetical protein [Anaerolineae bacterium]